MKVKDFTKLGESQRDVLEMLWEQPEFAWTYERGPGNGASARILDTLSRYESIAVPLEEGTEFGRVIKSDSGFRYEVLNAAAKAVDTADDSISLDDLVKAVEAEQLSKVEDLAPETDAFAAIDAQIAAAGDNRPKWLLPNVIDNVPDVVDHDSGLTADEMLPDISDEIATLRAQLRKAQAQIKMRDEFIKSLLSA